MTAKELLEAADKVEAHFKAYMASPLTRELTPHQVDAFCVAVAAARELARGQADKEEAKPKLPTLRGLEKYAEECQMRGPYHRAAADVLKIVREQVVPYLMNRTKPIPARPDWIPSGMLTAISAVVSLEDTA